MITSISHYLKPLALLALLLNTACSEPNNATKSTATTATTSATTSGAAASTAVQAQSQSGFYSFKMPTLDGGEVDFATLQGKKVLIVNTASKCGYTPQYKELQQLHETYGDQVVILGFPANNFGGQEPGSKEEIAEFCEKNYGVKFQMFDKVSVKGDDRHPLFTWLAQNAPNNETPGWNFSKYLIDENGKVIGFYPSKVKPMDEVLVSAITKK